MRKIIRLWLPISLGLALNALLLLNVGWQSGLVTVARAASLDPNLFAPKYQSICCRHRVGCRGLYRSRQPVLHSAEPCGPGDCQHPLISSEMKPLRGLRY